jgi:hypothetical protein
MNTLFFSFKLSCTSAGAGKMIQALQNTCVRARKHKSTCILGYICSAPHVMKKKKDDEGGIERRRGKKRKDDERRKKRRLCSSEQSKQRYIVTISYLSNGIRLTNILILEKYAMK